MTWSLESRTREAASRCLRPGTDDHFVLTRSVDAKGEIASVELDDDSDPHLAACVKSAVRRSIEPIEPGPARIKVGYFMGRLKQHTAGLPLLLP